MEFRSPETDAEIRWIADRYEQIGAASIPDYEVTEEGIEEAERFVRAQTLDESWRVVVAVGDATDDLAGMMICHVRNSPLDGTRECSIDAVHVEPSARRHGLGRRFLEEAERWGRARRAARIRTYVARSNGPMHALCLGEGFRETFVELCRPLEEQAPPAGAGARARGKRS
jgi:GNAT superfamily N-acetyltransferase